MAIETTISGLLTDAAIVEGVYHHDKKMGYAFYEVCHDYFMNHFRPIHYVNDYDRDDIFQNSMVTLLEKIEKRKIYVEDGILFGKNGKPFTSKLTTFFMGIAYLKYKEIFIQPPTGQNIDFESGKAQRLLSDVDMYKEILYDDEEDATISIIADCISKMSLRCSQILTLFYYKEKSLDEILEEIPSYKSKNALKTEKNKCMNSLRESANEIYKRFFN